MDSMRLYSLLTLTGATPFVACALLPMLGLAALEPLGRLDAIASSYGLAIASFVSGSHWGVFLRDAEYSPLNLFVTSNVALLAAWIAYIAAALHWQLVAQIIAFVFLWAVDQRLCQSGLITPHYFRVRTIATGIVCASLILIVAMG